MRKAASILGILLVITIPIHCVAASPSETLKKSQLRFFADPGLFIGWETKVSDRIPSFIRLHSESGLELEWRGADGRRAYCVGIAATGSVGWNDVRFGIGPRVAYRPGGRWAVQASGAIIGSTEHYDGDVSGYGWQARLGALYRNHFSTSVLYQGFPYRKPAHGGEPSRKGRLESVYCGVMAHGKPGLYTSLGIALVAGFLATYMVIGFSSM